MKTRHLLKLGLLFGIPGTMLAQDGEIQELEAIETETEVVDAISVLPDREIDSLFGVGKAQVEVPRSVTVIDGDLIERYNIEDVYDLTAVTPGAFTNSQFGVPGNVDIRGEPANIYFRGFLKLNNLGNFPTPIGATDSIEILNGPPPPVYGPGKIGGLLDFYPRTARGEGTRFLEESTGEIGVSYGATTSASIEFGMPYSVGDAPAGLYIYYLIEDSDSYFEGPDLKRQLYQFSNLIDVSENVAVEVGFQYQDSSFPQIPGVNRLTQDLVDKNRYITGRPHSLLDQNDSGFIDREDLAQLTGSFDRDPGPFFFGPEDRSQITFDFSQGTPSNIDFDGDGDLDPLGVYNRNGFSGSFESLPIGLDANGNQVDVFRLRLDTVGTETLDDETIIFDDADLGITRNFTAYTDVILFDPVNVIDEIKAQLFFDHYDTQRYTSYAYSQEAISYVVEGRLTANASEIEFGDILDINASAGGSIRYEQSDNHQNFGVAPTTQIFSRRDLTVGATANDRFRRTTDTTATGTGQDYVWDNDFESLYQAYGAFGVVDFSLIDWFAVTLGGRIDYTDTTSQNNGQNGTGIKYEDQQWVTNANLSFALTTPIGLVPYATFAWGSHLEVGQGNEVADTLVRDGTHLQDTELVEAGVKWDFADRIFVSAAWYWQTRPIFDSNTSVVYDIESTGVETALRAVITENVSVTAVATWSETTYAGDPEGVFVVLPAITERIRVINENGQEVTPENEGTFASGLSYEEERIRLLGGGRVATNNTAVQVLDDGDEVPGAPEFQASAFINFTGSDNLLPGLEATFGGTYVAETDAGYGEVTDIEYPDYFDLQASIGYTFMGWTGTFSITNLLDERYFRSAAIYPDSIGLPSEGRRYNLKLSYAW